MPPQMPDEVVDFLNGLWTHIRSGQPVGIRDLDHLPVGWTAAFELLQDCVLHAWGEGVERNGLIQLHVTSHSLIVRQLTIS
jgi:hypothetical protein